MIFFPRLSSILATLQRLARKVDWAALTVAAVAFAADWRTLAPSVLWSDEGEFQYCAYSLCVPHQTGYPLYVLLSRLWTLLPVGDIAYRVNLMSACWGAATVVLTYWCVKWLCGRRLLTAASALSLAFSSAFWMQSSIAGIRTFHTLFVALITLLTIGVAQRRASVEALALAIGLSLAHHRMTIFLLPGVAWALWQMRSQVAWSARRWLRVATLVAVPQTLYLFTWLGRSWGSSRSFWNFVLALNETPTVLAKTPAEITGQFTHQVLPSVRDVFTPVGLLIALIGLGVLIAARRNGNPRGIGGCLLMGWVLNILFAGVHFTEDPNKYLTHGFVLQAVALGAGLTAITAWLESKFAPRPMGRRVGWIALAFPVVLMATSWRAADQGGTGWIGPFTLDELASVESNSLVVADWSSTMPYRYHQIVNGQRRDLTIVLSGDAAMASRVEPALKNGQPLYLRERRLGKQWKGQLPFIPVERLWRVLPADPTFSAPQSVNESFGDDVRLAQIATWPPNLTADRLILLRLGWKFSRRIEHDLSISIRLADSDNMIWQHQESPLQDAERTGVLSTTAWVLGPALPPGDYHWQISVDDLSTGVNLGLSDLPIFSIGRPDHLVPLSSVVVAARPAEQPNVSGWNLIGYNSAGPAQPGGFVTLPLFWQAIHDASGPATARLELQDRQGHLVVEQTVTLPSSARQGDLIESRPGVVLPAPLADGRYEFIIVGSAAVRLCSLDVRGRTRVYRVPPITHRSQAQLGDSIELLGYEVNPDGRAVRPGGEINLQLVWRAKGVMGRGVKVFVHVLDGDGKLLVQKDGVPGNWSLPTDTWVAGEVIVDPYTIPIPPEAAPGDYRVQVGMYLPDTGQRLPALQAGSRLTDDSIPLTTLTIQ